GEGESLLEPHRRYGGGGGRRGSEDRDQGRQGFATQLSAREGHALGSARAVPSKRPRRLRGREARWSARYGKFPAAKRKISRSTEERLSRRPRSRTRHFAPRLRGRQIELARRS